MNTINNAVHTASYKTSTGAVKASQGIVSAFLLTAGSDAATLTLSNAADISVPLIVVKAAANTTASAALKFPVLFSTAIHATLAGTGPVATIIYL